MGRPPNPRKTFFDCEQSAEEKAAQLWHDGTGHSQRGTDCWCCCSLCKFSNPHERHARRAALADIASRIRESIKHIRPPDGKKKNCRPQQLQQDQRR